MDGFINRSLVPGLLALLLAGCGEVSRSGDSSAADTRVDLVARDGPRSEMTADLPLPDVPPGDRAAADLQPPDQAPADHSFDTAPDAPILDAPQEGPQPDGPPDGPGPEAAPDSASKDGAADGSGPQAVVLLERGFSTAGGSMAGTKALLVESSFETGAITCNQTAKVCVTGGITP